MREFADQHVGLHGEALRGAFTSVRPVRAFVAAARDAGLGAEWHETRARHVREVIETWAAREGLQVDLEVERPLLAAPDWLERTSDGGTSESGGRDAEAVSRNASGQRSSTAEVRVTPLHELRKRIAAAVMVMPKGDLLRLAIPLEYLVEDKSERGSD